MAWLWNTWEEYLSVVAPVEVGRGAFGAALHWTRFETTQLMLNAWRDLKEAYATLHKLGFEDDERPSNDPAISAQAREFVVVAINSGERLLLYHKRLALSRAAKDFLHEKDILEHWDRYATTRRIAVEIHQLTKATGELLLGYEQLMVVDERLIVDDIELPIHLESDFRLSRNLFSMGFDDMGLLAAGRGLEGVLREIARLRRILLQVKGKKPKPACEIDFYDLIEVMFRVRWKVRDVPLISRETKSLLQFLRTIRNSGAHRGDPNDEMSSPRETAVVIARTATHVWNSVANSRARIYPISVEKDWP